MSEADRPVQTLNQSGAERAAELESFSCRPADVPHPHVLMAFYGSLESLWLLLTQWDSLQRQKGLQREGQPQYIADATIVKDVERRCYLAAGEILTLEILDFGFLDLECITHLDGLVPWITFLPNFKRLL